MSQKKARANNVRIQTRRVLIKYQLGLRYLTSALHNAPQEVKCEKALKAFLLQKIEKRQVSIIFQLLDQKQLFLILNNQSNQT
jgi:hypothetical protein